MTCTVKNCSLEKERGDGLFCKHHRRKWKQLCFDQLSLFEKIPQNHEQTLLKEYQENPYVKGFRMNQQ